MDYFTDRTAAMRAAREKAGFSQAELARRAGVLQCMVNKWENGVCDPSIFSAICVTEVLGISIDEYIGRGTGNGS